MDAERAERPGGRVPERSGESERKQPPPAEPLTGDEPAMPAPSAEEDFRAGGGRRAVDRLTG